MFSVKKKSMKISNEYKSVDVALSIGLFFVRDFKSMLKFVSINTGCLDFSSV